MKSKIWVYIVCIALVVVATVLIFRYGPDSHVDIPEIALPAPAASDAGGAGASGGDSVTLVDVTPDTVQAVLATLARVSNYSRQLTVETFWSSGSSLSDISVWVRGKDVRITEACGSTVRNVLILGQELLVWYPDLPGTHSSVIAGDPYRYADEYQRLYTYEDILKLNKSAISGAGYTELNGELCIFVEYTSGELGYRHAAYVSVDTGLLTGFESFDSDGSVIYRMTAQPPNISTPDDEIFLPPDAVRETA